jgi:cytochrome c556
MKRFLQSFPRLRIQLTAAICSVPLVAGAFALSSVAFSQDQAIPKDTIFARKILMDSIGRNMDELEEMTTSSKINLAEGKEHADIVSVMLMAFPHLFPPSTNQWRPNAQQDPGTDTFAAPELWANFADFYSKAAAASKIAYKASRTESVDEFKDFIAQLRVACDSCHGGYLKSQ